MGNGDELLFVTEGDDALPVLKPDRARGLEARRVEAHKFVKQRRGHPHRSPRFGMKLKAAPPRHLCGIIIPQMHRGDYPRRQQSSAECQSSLDGNAGQKVGRISGCGSSRASLRGGGRRPRVPRWRAACGTRLASRRSSCRCLSEGSRRYASSRASQRLIDACP